MFSYPQINGVETHLVIIVTLKTCESHTWVGPQPSSQERDLGERHWPQSPLCARSCIIQWK